MDYKTSKHFFTNQRERLLQEFFNVLESDVKNSFIIEIEHNEVMEMPINNVIDQIVDYMAQMYIRDQENICDMFNPSSEALLCSTLNYILYLFSNMEMVPFQVICDLHFVEFVSWILIQCNHNSQFIYDALKVFSCIYKLQITDQVLNTMIYIFPQLKSEESYIRKLALNVIGDFFEYNLKVGIFLLNYDGVISDILFISKETKYELVCSQALLFLRSLLYHTIFDQEFGDQVPPELVEQIIKLALPHLSRSRPNLTSAAIKILQTVSLNLNMLTIAKKNGIDSSIIKGLTCVESSQIIEIYKIIRNILNFASKGEIQTNIITNGVFFKKTAELLKKVDQNCLGVILSTIDILGRDFWITFFKYDVLDSLIEIINKTDYINKKHIVSILLHFFEDVNVSFRRKYCTHAVIEQFVSMLDDDDSVFCFELVQALSTLYYDDGEYFRPILIELEFGQCLFNLSTHVDSQLAQLAENIYNHLD
ncbi:hypothetical protein TRFO_17924 [Tritrichomonas foetus]|uniref:Uncharacterized protein n=1 Tax=Tritrichomonas foetus TaxID=1144522 RepID=A0A1J4KRA1_9EUKA|nr:hypothetical protein TRFO_17924 [Tritrichomonas foetus]|eukprot:OHT12332.1 hypothetical protein TRFO_17924 [Tritrichomonas foetus]